MGWKLNTDNQSRFGVSYYWDWDAGDEPQLLRARGMPRSCTPMFRHRDIPAGTTIPGDDPLPGDIYWVGRIPLECFDVLLKEQGMTRQERRIFLGVNPHGLILRNYSCDSVGGVLRSRQWLNTFGWMSALKSEDVSSPYYQEYVCLYNTVVLENRFRWHVELRRSDKHLAVALPTDATGVLALLQDREKNGTKRKPLLHWVNEHLRQNRSDPDALDYVRAYLRGSRKCLWRGYQVEIRESEQERELVANK